MEGQDVLGSEHLTTWKSRWPWLVWPNTSGWDSCIIGRNLGSCFCKVWNFKNDLEDFQKASRSHCQEDIMNRCLIVEVLYTILDLNRPGASF